MDHAQPPNGWKIPLPAHVEVVHLLPSHLLASKKDNRWHRTAHSVDLLQSLTLQLRLDDDDQHSTLYYQAALPFPTVRPRWEHLHEHLTSLTLAQYEKLSICLLCDDDNDNNQLWTQLPAHPGRLVELDDNSTTSFPLNTVLIHFTDGKTRVLPQVGKTLGVTPTENEYARFQSEAFGVLEAEVEYDYKNHLNGDENGGLCNGDDDNEWERVIEEEAKHRRQKLEAQLATEERLLREDMARWEAQKEQRKVLQEETMELQQQTAQVHESKAALLESNAKLQLLLEAQRLQLVKELAVVYPISTKDGRWTIRNIVLELNHSSDDDLSAALGFLCHLVHMLSKYLAIRPRYKLKCYSSRSMIQDDRGQQAYPLFLGKPAEREKMAQGWKLLEDNVECLCHARCVDFQREMHVLEKVQLLVRETTALSSSRSTTTNGEQLASNS